MQVRFQIPSKVFCLLHSGSQGNKKDRTNIFFISMNCNISMLDFYAQFSYFKTSKIIKQQIKYEEDTIINN